jgi:hypothetical protein
VCFQNHEKIKVPKTTPNFLSQSLSLSLFSAQLGLISLSAQLGPFLFLSPRPSSLPRPDLAQPIPPAQLHLPFSHSPTVWPHLSASPSTSSRPPPSRTTPPHPGALPSLYLLPFPLTAPSMRWHTHTLPHHLPFSPKRLHKRRPPPSTALVVPFSSLFAAYKRHPEPSLPLYFFSTLSPSL